MALVWRAEQPAKWDDSKARIVGGAAAGIFDSRYKQLKPGALVPGDWWRVERDGAVVGFGWMDVSFGDAEVLLATDATAQRSGVGRFILDCLDVEARARGLNYLTNIVRPSHPQQKEVGAWLVKQGFAASDDGRLIRAVKRN